MARWKKKTEKTEEISPDAVPEASTPTTMTIEDVIKKADATNMQQVIMKTAPETAREHIEQKILMDDSAVYACWSKPGYCLIKHGIQFKNSRFVTTDKNKIKILDEIIKTGKTTIELINKGKNLK